MPPSTLVTATVRVDADKHVLPGLSLCQWNQQLIVTAIDENGPLAAAGTFKAGMQLLALQNTPCDSMTPAQAMALLKHADIQGEVTILAKPVEACNNNNPPELITAVCYKDHKDVLVGLKLTTTDKKDKDSKKLLVQEIQEQGLLSHANIAPGMQLLSINNVSVLDPNQWTPQSVAENLKNATGVLTFLCATEQTIEANRHKSKLLFDYTEFVTATVASFRNGLTLQPTLQGEVEPKVVISDVNEAFVSSHLRPGMEIVSIFNIPVANTDEALNLLESANGKVILLAKKGPAKRAGRMITAVLPPSDKIGLTLTVKELNHHRFVVISDIGKKSDAFCHSDLEPGMILFTLNQKLCHERPLSEVVHDLFQPNDDNTPVTLLAQVPTAQPSLECPLITTCIHKPNSSDRVGISLKKYKDTIVISNIQAGGLAQQQGVSLKLIGTSLLQVNNHQITGSTTCEQAARLFAAAKEWICLLTEPAPVGTMDGGFVTASIQKTTMDQKVGISLAYTNAGNVVVTRILDDSPFYPTALRPSLAVHSINNQKCKAKSAVEVAMLLKEAPVDRLELVARDPKKASLAWNNNHHPQDLVAGVSPRQVGQLIKDDTDKNLVSVTLEQEQLQQYKQCCVQRNGQIFVSDETGMFQGTAMRAGMQLLSVNNLDCKLTSMPGVIGLLQQSEAPVTILALDTGRGKEESAPDAAREESKEESAPAAAKEESKKQADENNDEPKKGEQVKESNDVPDESSTMEEKTDGTEGSTNKEEKTDTKEESEESKAKGTSDERKMEDLSS